MNIALIISVVFAIIFGIIFIGFIFETISTFLDKKRYKTPSGELVSVGEHKLHIIVMGERETGTPAIVMDAGVGNNSLDWQLVQPKLAEFSQAISYDRAGYGWSDESQKARTSYQIIEELHTLLHNAGIEPPYLLVGHSFGGIHVRLFAEKYPEETAGLVLVDSSHPEMLAERNTEPELRRLKNVQYFQRIGIVRLMLKRSLSQTKHLSEEARKQYLAFYLMDSQNTLREAEPLFRHGIEKAKAITIPLTIISRAKDEEISGERKWSEYQYKLAELSTEAKHIHAETSNHSIALTEPDTVVNAIREMYENFNSLSTSDLINFDLREKNDNSNQVTGA